MTSDARAVSALPPAGWLYDPYTSQTRWWNGFGWTEHVLPAHEDTEYAASLGTYIDPGEPQPARNGPAHASVILIAVQMLGTIAVLGVVGASGAQWWQMIGVLSGLGALSVGVAASALVLAIIGMFVAVRRPTRKHEAVVALVVSALLLLGLLTETMVWSVHNAS